MHASKKISIATDRVVKAFNDITVNAGESIINDGEINALLGTGTTAVTTLDLSNNGLIGGYDVTINSDAIENIGALYAKNDLSVVGETLNNSGVIRSNRDMDLLIEDTLSNQKEGTIYSDGSLSIAANGVKDKINTIDNYGVIQSGNNLNISAKTLNNLADAPVINPVTASTTTVIPQGGANDFDIITVTTTTDVIDVPNDPALILSAGDMSIDAENINNFYSLIASDADMILNADSVKNVGNVLVTTVVTVTTKYRDEKYCSRKVLGSCVSHKHRPGYRGTFTTTENERIPLSNAGIIAKNSISGNVVTLNNLSDQLNGALDAQQILDNLATITVLETSSSQLQELTVLLQNANTELIESIGTTSNIDAIITDAVDKNDLSVFNENMTLLQTDLHQAITDSADSISTFETLIATIKTQNTAEGTHYDTAALESTLEQLKNNISAVEQHLSDIETLQASLQTLNDLQTQKDSFLASDQAIRTLMTENTEVLDTLDIAPLTSGFEVASDALRAEVNTALALQENVEYKIITQDEGLYQTNLHRNLTANPAIAYSESTEAIIDGITLPQGKYGLFLVNQDINHPYLIEQNPLYTDYNTFISSDYILERLGFEPDNTLKRLGDGAYETQLVRDSVIRLSGERYLGNYTSDAEQYQALMDNALRVQAELGLVIGVSLTQDQIAGLADNIVWLEEKTIEGIKVLVPRVYLASGALNESGPKIAANTIDLNVANSLTNDGVIQASDTLSLNAKTIKNINGVLSSGGDMAVQTQGDLTNTSGTISSGGDMSLRAGGAITSDVTSQQVQYNYARGVQTATQKGKTSQISAGGTLSAQADQSITLNNADVKAKEDVTLISQNGDVNVDAFKTDDAYDFRLKNGYTKGNSTTYEGSSITGKNVSLGGDKITLTASAIDAQGNLVLAGKEEVALIAQNDHTYTDTKIKSSNGLFGSKVQQDTVYKESTVGSTLNAQNITIASGKDVTLQAADLKAADTIEVDAAGDINVLAKEYREGELHSVKKSSFGGLIGSSTLDSKDALKLHEATLKTEAKNIIMNSGKDINVVASNVSAGDTLGLKASQNVNVLSDEEQNTQQHYSKKSGLSLGFSDGMLTVAEEKQTSDANANIMQKSSSLSGKTLSVEAGQDVTAIGSNMTASTIDVNAQRDVNLLSATESASHEHKESIAKAGIGVTLNMNEASLFAGVITKSDKLGEGQTQEVGSQLVGDNISVHSGNSTNVLASNVVASNDISIQADKNINILSQDATTYKNQVHEELKAGIKVGVQQHVTDAAKQLADTAESFPESDNAVSAGSKVLKSVDLITNTLSHSVSAGFDAIAEMSKSETSSESTSAQSSTIAAGHDVTLDAAKEITVAGSDIIANNKISMNAEAITLKSSGQNASSSSSEKSGSLKVTLYGTNEGQVDASYAQSKNRSNNTIQRDTYVAGNDIIINTSGDTTLHGAHVTANIVTANVGGNLNLISVQDTGSSKGDSESISLSTAGSGSVGAGKSSSSKAWVEEQTGIIATEKVDITVAKNTDLQGAIIATKDANGNDANNVHLTTGTLSASDISDHDKSTSMNIGIGNISASQFQANSKGTTGATLEARYGYSDKEQINRATIGGGTITLTDQETVPTTLNRDTSKAQEITKNESENYDVYASQSSINQTLNPTQTAKDWGQAIDDMGLSVHKEITENLPDSNSKGLAGVVGTVLDTAGGAGVLPSQGNAGGYVTQIATQLFGDNRTGIIVESKETLLKAGVSKDDIQEVILIKTEKGVKKAEDFKDTDTVLDTVTVYRTDPNKTVIIGDLTDKTGDPSLENYKIRLSAEDVKNSGITHLFTNGMFNSIDTAAYNQQTQQGRADGILNYNQQHGIVGDLLESAQDALAVNTGLSALGTGGARQTGEVIDQMATITQGNLTVGAHSQGTLMSQVGMEKNKEHLQELVQGNKDSKFLVGYAGSPVNHQIAEELVSDIYGGKDAIKTHIKDGTIGDVFRSNVSPQDAVGSFLGWQSAGINNSENLGNNVWESFLATPRLFGIGGDSSHSYYPCVIGCGNENYTPDIKNYYTPDAKDGVKEHPRSEYYQDNFTNEKGQRTINMDLLPQSDKSDSTQPNTQTILDTIKG
ncbi:hemagglutinin repeat-containing protein [Sulfuricurvum sp.]|uniref:hemagglutinin repeat-containing protein n=1 Tax=Sulfuricurvum sp. TaxID=2025608 RepID=UPI00261811BD|nr:hemagglutinin repeat-containing protein [Sulfuricurvum sp.]MDD3597212.1 hemagglutinin repeat-containing protein [Sulfuricurvum sp.]